MATKKTVTEQYVWNKYDNMPTAYKDYQKKLKEGTKRISTDAKTRLSRFPYRYRLAKSFVGIDAKEVGNTLIGYEAGMKVFLAYTAYEELIGTAYKLRVENIKKKNENKIQDKELADKFRKKDVLITFIQLNIPHENIYLKEKFEAFIKCESNDVLFLALAIRNLYAHGVFTATKGGVKNLKDKVLYFELAHTILFFCDECFSKCIDKIGGEK